MVLRGRVGLEVTTWGSESEQEREQLQTLKPEEGGRLARPSQVPCHFLWDPTRGGLPPTSVLRARRACRRVSV